MEPTDAIVLTNWFPDGGGVTVRGGSASFATGLGSGNVETIAEYYAGSVRKFLAACTGSIFDITAGGVVGAALASGFSSNRWQTVNFKTKQFWVNGADAPQEFDGTVVTASGWSGLTTSNLIGVAVFKERLFFIEKDSANFWYTATSGAVTGALTKFPLSMVGSSGGNLVAICPVSHDGGDGLDDFCAFVLSSGEIFIYQGSNPGDATAWSLAGHYVIGAPLGTRAVARFGGDVYITTADDHVPLSQWLIALRSGQVPPRSKMSGAVTELAQTNASLFGWDTILYPNGKRIIFNVPMSDGTFIQHVYNTANNAFCIFNGMNASCWSLFNNNLYFGTTGGAVWQADTGLSDGGTAIQADGQQAWNSFGSAYRKRIAAARPIVQSTGNINYSLGIGTDYKDADASIASAAAPGGSYWDVSTWDVALWSPESGIDVQWRVDGGWGVSISPRLRVAALQSISWLRTDLRLETGNAL
jgi:hypothetical protein